METERIVKEEILKVFKEVSPSELALLINLNRYSLEVCLESIKPIENDMSEEFIRALIRTVMELAKMGLTFNIKPL